MISSYLVADGSQFRRSLLLSFAASLVQAVSAILLVGLLSAALHLTRFEIDSHSKLLEEGSYGPIILIGGWMLVSSLRSAIGSGRSHSACGSHSHALDPRTLESPRGSPASTWRGTAAVILATGLRPCSGALLVLLFTAAQGLFLAGVGAAFIMALGTGVTISALAVLAVQSRRAALRIARAESAWQARIHSGLSIASACLVIASGLLFLLATASQSPSL